MTPEQNRAYYEANKDKLKKAAKERAAKKRIENPEYIIQYR
jgi:hypothetical protein